MVTDCGVAAVGEWAGAPVADARRVVGVAAEYPCRDLCHEAAVIVADAVPYHVVAHLGCRFSDWLFLSLALAPAPAPVAWLSSGGARNRTGSRAEG